MTEIFRYLTESPQSRHFFLRHRTENPDGGILMTCVIGVIDTDIDDAQLCFYPTSELEQKGILTEFWTTGTRNFGGPEVNAIEFRLRRYCFCWKM